MWRKLLIFACALWLVVLAGCATPPAATPEPSQPRVSDEQAQIAVIRTDGSSGQVTLVKLLHNDSCEREALLRVLRQKQHVLLYCDELTRQRGGDFAAFSGELDVAWEIDAQGATQSVKIERSTTPHEEVGACYTRAWPRFKFEPLAADATGRCAATVTLRLEPKKP